MRMNERELNRFMENLRKGISEIYLNLNSIMSIIEKIQDEYSMFVRTGSIYKKDYKKEKDNYKENDSRGDRES